MIAVSCCFNQPKKKSPKISVSRCSTFFSPRKWRFFTVWSCEIPTSRDFHFSFPPKQLALQFYTPGYATMMEPTKTLENVFLNSHQRCKCPWCYFSRGLAFNLLSQLYWYVLMTVILPLEWYVAVVVPLGSRWMQSVFNLWSKTNESTLKVKTSCCNSFRGKL